MITISPCIGPFCGDRQLANNGKSTSVDAGRIPVLGEHARTVKVDTLALLFRRKAGLHIAVGTGAVASMGSVVGNYEERDD